METNTYKNKYKKYKIKYRNLCESNNVQPTITYFYHG